MALDKKPDIIFRPAQAAAVRNLVKRRLADGTLHPSQKEQRLGELALSIRNTGIANTLRNFEPLEKIRSEQLNDIIDRIYVDLFSLYRSTFNTQNVVNAKKQKANQRFTGVNDSFLKLKSDAKSHLAVYENPEYDEIRKITFADKRNETRAEHVGVVDSRSGRLVLNPRKSTNIISVADITPSVTFTENSQQVFEAVTGHGIEKAVDPDPESFWSAIVINDQEADFAEAEITLKFSSAQDVSAVYVLPFATYPLKVTELDFSVDGTNYESIPTFDGNVATQNTDYIPILFPKITARFIRITMRQNNSLERERFLPVGYEEITQQDIQDRISLSLERVDFSDPDNRSGQIREDLLAALTEALVRDPDSLNVIHGFEYIFGIADIAIYKTDYEVESEYAGPRFANTKNVFSVEMDVTETVSALASAEYAVEIGNDRRIPILPRNECNEVTAELLHFNGGSFTGFTRFELDTTKTVTVFENGNLLDNDFYFYDEESITVHTNLVGFKPDLSKFYSASYTAKTGGSLIFIHDNFISVPIESPETFINTDPTGRLRLRAFPHIEYSIINDLVNFYFQNGLFVYSGDINTVLGATIDAPNTTKQLNLDQLGAATTISYLDGIAYGSSPDTKSFYEPISITVDGVRAVNVTDYVGGLNKTLSREPLGGTVFNFIQEGNEIIFGTRITGRQIVIQYNIMAEYIRPTITLRRLTSDDQTVTAQLKDLTLLMKARTI